MYEMYIKLMATHFSWYPSADSVTVPWSIIVTNYRRALFLSFTGQQDCKDDP